MDNKKSVTKEEAVVGDYVYIDGDSGFCYGCFEKIKAFETRYNEKTGKPYKVVITSSDDVYRFDDGVCLKGASAYRIFGYARDVN